MGDGISNRGRSHIRTPQNNLPTYLTIYLNYLPLFQKDGISLTPSPRHRYGTGASCDNHDIPANDTAYDAEALDDSGIRLLIDAPPFHAHCHTDTRGGNGKGRVQNGRVSRANVFM
jgi:hypothetical protein